LIEEKKNAMAALAQTAFGSTESPQILFARSQAYSGNSRSFAIFFPQRLVELYSAALSDEVGVN
jgi:hypothetical protein